MQQNVYNITATRITVKGPYLERVQEYLHLGIWIKKRDQPSQKWRLRLVDQKFKCYIFSILLYGAEAWTLTKEMQKKCRFPKCFHFVITENEHQKRTPEFY